MKSPPADHRLHRIGCHGRRHGLAARTKGLPDARVRYARGCGRCLARSWRPRGGQPQGSCRPRRHRVRLPADLAGIVFACLPSAAASRPAALGDEGVINGRALRTYVETSTIGVATVKEIGAACDQPGRCAGQRRSALCAPGQARRHDGGAAGRARRRNAGFSRLERQAVLYRRRSRPRPGDETGEQPVGRRRPCHHRPGHGPGRQGRP